MSRRVVILLDIEVLKDGSEVGVRIGNPEGITSDRIDSANDGGDVAPPKQPQYRPQQTNTGTITTDILFIVNTNVCQKSYITLQVNCRSSPKSDSTI